MRFGLIKLIFVFSILAAANFVAAQEKCGLNLADAPAIKNLRLGMSPPEASAALGGALKIKNISGGDYRFFQNYIKDAPPAALAGVRAVYLRFFDNKLYQIEIFYQERSKDKSLENFLAELSANFNLPPSLWKIEYGQARIECGGFSMTADDVLNPRLQLTDEAIRAKVTEKR